MTPLHWAVENDYPNLVKLLLQYGSDPEAESKYKDTPISIASDMGFDDIFEMLAAQQCEVKYFDQNL